MTIRGAIHEIRDALRLAPRQPELNATETHAAGLPATPERTGFEPYIPRGGINEINQGIGASTGSDRRSSLTELYEAYLACPWSWASVNAISRTITAGGLVVDWDGDDGEGDQVIPPKPAEVVAMERLFSYCNPREDIRQLLRGVITDLEVFGDAYIEVVWVGTIPVALYSLDSTSMYPVADEHGTISKYVQVTDYGQRAEFEPREVIHISLDSPRSGVFGVSPTQANLLPMMAWLYAAATAKETFRKGLPPNIHVDFPAGTSDTSINRWDQMYRARNIGPRNIGAPIITKGGATVTEMQQGSIKDLIEFLDQKRDEILAGYGVPPAQAGVIESGNLGGGTGESQRKTFLTNTCNPIAALVLEKLQFHIALQGFGVEGWTLKFAEIDMRDSQVVEEIRDTRVRNGTYTVNRGRAEIGEPPVPGGDEAVIIDRQNMTLVRDLAAASQAGIASKVKGTALEPDEPVDGQPMRLLKTPPAPAPAAQDPPATGGRHRSEDDEPMPEESAFAREWRALSEQWTPAYRHRRRRALAALEHQSSPGDSYHDHDHHNGPDYEPAELGVDRLYTVRVDPTQVQVDHAYQRRQAPVKVDAIAAEPVGRLAQRVGLLARREDGTYWVIDGQHHTAAAIERGITSMTYQCFDSTGPEMEAEVYAAWQRWDREERPDLPAKHPADLVKA